MPFNIILITTLQQNNIKISGRKTVKISLTKAAIKAPIKNIIFILIKNY